MGGIRSGCTSLFWASGAVFLSLSLAGCATVTRGSHEMFSVISQPTGAQAYLSSGDSCVTPCQMRMQRGNPFEVRIVKPGYITKP